VPDSLTLFGLLAVTAMLVFYALEDRSRWFVLAFAEPAPWIALRLSPGRVALRPHGGGVGAGRGATLDDSRSDTPLTTRASARDTGLRPLGDCRAVDTPKYPGALRGPEIL